MDEPSTPNRPSVWRFAALVLVLVGLVIAWASLTSGSRAGRRGALEPARGRLLVAAPRLLDPNFAQTVVLLTDVDEDGAMGLILNRPTDVSMSDALPWLPEIGDRDDLLSIGGPVKADSLVVLLRADRDLPHSVHVFGDVWMTGDLRTLREVLGEEIPAERMRAFLGFAGWAPGQLEAEIARGGWEVHPARIADVFGGNLHRLWRDLIDRVPPQVARSRAAPLSMAGSRFDLRRGWVEDDMDTLEITVTLDTPDDTDFAARSLGVAARLAAWPGLVCAGMRTDPSRRTMSGRYLVSRRGRSRGVATDALETSLRRAPAVASVRFGHGRTMDAPPSAPDTGRTTFSGVAASYQTTPQPNFGHAA